MFCGYKRLSIAHGKRFSRGKVYIRRFLEFCQEKIDKASPNIFQQVSLFKRAETEHKWK